MFFHWLKLYGKAGPRATIDATQVVDTIFARARAASPAVFGADSSFDAARKAKFEHMCPWLAQALLPLNAPQTRTVLEAMIDRLEVGLRENGVGDMKVGKEVRAYAAALHGRVSRYMPLLRQKNTQGLAIALQEHGIDPALAQSLGH